MIKGRWFASVLHACLWVLLALMVLRLRGTSPPFHETTSHTSPAHTLVPVARLEHLFASDQWPNLAGETNSLSPFGTRHFIPPVTPVAAPTTRKVELTYQGFFQTGNDPQRVFIKVDDALMLSQLGGQIATNLFVANATMQSLTLTNLAAQTNVLTLNTKKILEVPIR